MEGLRRTIAIDGALTLVLLAIAGVALHVVDDADNGHAVVPVLLAALVLPLALRRWAPAAVAIVVSVVSAAVWVTGAIDGPTAVIGAIALYTLGRYATPPRSVHVFGASIAVLAVTGLVLAIRESSGDAWFEFASRLSVATGPFWLGESLRARTELAETYRQRAERAERDRADEARRAVDDERSRIARELHDVVTHSVSVMIVQSDVADRLAATDPARAREAIRGVAAVARTTMAEMRRVVEVLGTAGTGAQPGFAPQPTLADLAVLVERCLDAGLVVDVEGLDRLPPIAPGAQLSMFRIVQEATTNTLKHAGASRVTVRFSATDGIELVVVDDGNEHTASLHVPGAGRGLVGMRERVQALHGRLDAGPDTRGTGFRVAARFPYEAVVAGPVVGPVAGVAR